MGETEMGRVSGVLGEGPTLQQATGQDLRPPRGGRGQYQSQGVMGLESGIPPQGCGLATPCLRSPPASLPPLVRIFGWQQHGDGPAGPLPVCTPDFAPPPCSALHPHPNSSLPRSTIHPKTKSLPLQMVL